MKSIAPAMLRFFIMAIMASWPSRGLCMMGVICKE